MLPLPNAPKQGKISSPCYPGHPQTTLLAPGCPASFPIGAPISQPCMTLVMAKTFKTSDFVFHCLQIFAVAIPLFFYQQVVGEDFFFFLFNHLYVLSLFLSLSCSSLCDQGPSLCSTHSYFLPQINSLQSYLPWCDRFSISSCAVLPDWFLGCSKCFGTYQAVFEECGKLKVQLLCHLEYSWPLRIFWISLGITLSVDLASKLRPLPIALWQF